MLQTAPHVRTQMKCLFVDVLHFGEKPFSLLRPREIAFCHCWSPGITIQDGHIPWGRSSATLSRLLPSMTHRSLRINSQLSDGWPPPLKGIAMPVGTER